MARAKTSTKTVTEPVNNIELAKTLKVDNQTYNVNAVHADTSDQAVKVQGTLTINNSNLDGSESEIIAFDGSRDIALPIVSVAGGKFKGDITVPSKGVNTTILNEDVLNFGDIRDKVVPLLMNTSVFYSWNGSELNPTSEDSDNTTINGISVIYGEEDLVQGFAQFNTTNSQLAAYLYVCANSGNIYFGTVNLNTANRLASKTAQLDISRTITTDLSNKNVSAEGFNGSSNINIGITGILGVENGGTGQNNLNNVSVGIANAAHSLVNTQDILVNLASISKASFNGTATEVIEPGISGILGTSNGGTGKSSLQDVTVGTAEKMTTYTSTSSGTTPVASHRGTRVIISTNAPTKNDGQIGDIWIQYK